MISVVDFCACFEDSHAKKAESWRAFPALALRRTSKLKNFWRRDVLLTMNQRFIFRKGDLNILEENLNPDLELHPLIKSKQRRSITKDTYCVVQSQEIKNCGRTSSKVADNHQTTDMDALINLITLSVCTRELTKHSSADHT